MLLSIQFPFADLRGFVTDSGRLTVPGWPFPTPDMEFVRYLGSVRRRQAGGVEGWAGENEVCEADRALRFERSPTFLDRASGGRLVLRCVYRRFYFDGLAVGKFEVGIGTQAYARQVALDAAQSEAILGHVLRLPVRVRDALTGQVVRSDLAQAGRRLVDLYEAASTGSRQPTITVQPWWVQPGAPLLFWALRAEEQAALPFRVNPVALPEGYNFQLSFLHLRHAGGSLPLWVLGPIAVEERERARALRLYLTRLHAEHECLKLVLRAISDGRVSATRGSAPSEALQRYLSEALKRIQRLERNSAKQFDAEVADVARNLLEFLNPGQGSRLLAALESLDVRPAVFNKVQQYITQREAGSAVSATIHAEMVALRNVLSTHFNLAELEQLTLDLNLNYENLAGDTLDGKAQELVQAIFRYRGAEGLTELRETLEVLRAGLV